MDRDALGEVLRLDRAVPKAVWQRRGGRCVRYLAVGDGDRARGRSNRCCSRASCCMPAMISGVSPMYDESEVGAVYRSRFGRTVLAKLDRLRDVPTDVAHLVVFILLAP